MTTWSDLLPEILNTIAGKLHFYEDYINFLCVCTSWNSSITTSRNVTQLLPSRFPMLMLAESDIDDEEDDQHRRFLLLSNGGTVRTLPLPEAHLQRCVSSQGWLLTTGEEEFCTKLVHPLSRAKIDLPELYMFEELYYDQDEWVYYGFCMRKTVLTSSNPLSDPSFRVIIIWGRTIGFCRPGDVSWSQITGREGHLFDIAYHSMRKRLYVVATLGTIYECDIFHDASCPLTLSRVTKFPDVEFGSSFLPCAYLLEWGDNGLLMITRERLYFKKQDDEYKRYGPYRTDKFQCYAFGLDDQKWSKITSFGGKSVFVGFNSSFAIDGGDEVKPNCIYFTDDLYEPYRGLPERGGGDVGIYHMFDGTIERIFGSQGSIFRCTPPLWLQTDTSCS